MIAENLGHDPSQNEVDYIPRQRDMEHQSGRMVSLEFAEAAGRMAAHEMVVIENGPVFALAGNARDPEILRKIQDIKTNVRGGAQPVGLVTGFDITLSGYLSACEAINIDAVRERKLQSLMDNPELLTRRLGALAFLRAPADHLFKQVVQLPDAIVPPRPGSAIQLFSPVGSPRGESFAQAALDKGVLLTMTSANISGQPEIVTGPEARAFAQAVPGGELMVLQQYADDKKPLRPRGSYPVLEVMSDHLSVVRPGFLHPDLIQALFSDYDVRLPGNYRVPNYPDNVLRRQDLPAAHRCLQQGDLRLAILETMA